MRSSKCLRFFAAVKVSSPIPKRQKSQSQDSTLSPSKFHHRPSICHCLNFRYTSRAYQPLVFPFTVAVKQGIGGISSNPLDPQSEATNTITRSWEPQSWQRRETSAQEHLVSGLRDQILGFHQITFHLQRIHQTRSFWTLINNLTKHYHLNDNQTILRFLLLLIVASNIELYQSFGFQSRDSSVYNVHSAQCKLSSF